MNGTYIQCQLVANYKWPAFSENKVFMQPLVHITVWN